MIIGVLILLVYRSRQKKVCGPIWVRGGIPIESCDGSSYAVRNQGALCRCGKSRNKPFCDATHVSKGYRAKKIKANS
ncbi:MAG TPA: CDGSH iron-sulfur domain-containing protein [Desulfosporosinus sp.]|nr:CDGSH iron-sulfur domain-containing protein [Desulfosporosinus sp.]